MSLLWPESVQVGLFPGECWLRRGRSALTFAAARNVQSEQWSLPNTLDDLLTQHEADLKQGTNLHLTVSDSVAAIAVLPWQEQLTTREELQGYALAALEQQGLDIGADWTVQTAFRQHQSAGVAFAVATSLLEKLQAVVALRGKRLASVLPVSLAAFHRHRHPARAKHSMILLREMQRLTAMVYEQGCLQRIDVEPLIAGAEAMSGRRLLTRVHSAHGEFHAVDEWAAVRLAAPAVSIGDCLPDAAARALPVDVWS